MFRQAYKMRFFTSGQRKKIVQACASEMDENVGCVTNKHETNILELYSKDHIFDKCASLLLHNFTIVTKRNLHYKYSHINAVSEYFSNSVDIDIH